MAPSLKVTEPPGVLLPSLGSSAYMGGHLGDGSEETPKTAANWKSVLGGLAGRMEG